MESEFLSCIWAHHWRNLIKYLVDSDECVEWTEVRENGQEAIIRVWLDG